jgi:two-component system chemotaxis response regulator CheY
MKRIQKTILLIDDDVGLLDVLAFALGEAGFQVAARVPQGVSLRQELKALPDLIIVDGPLSGEDERSLSRELKIILQTKYIPLLLISSQSNTRSSAYKAGVTAFLAKPFDLSSFLMTVEKCLRASSDLR